MAFAIDGLASGLDTTSLITSLMQIEAIPQTLLKQRSASTQGFVSALQTLNARVATLATTATAAARPDALDAVTATSSGTGATVTAAVGASTGSFELVVDRLAQRQVLVSDAVTAWDSTTLTIADADGAETIVTADSTALSDIAAAINEAAAGVSATVVTLGDGRQRLQLSSTEAGSDAAFTVSGTTTPFTSVQSAQDAQLRLWAGTAAEQEFTSSGNRFASLLPGVDVTVRAVSSDPVTVTVSRDAAAAQRTVAGLVEQVAGVISHISANSRVTNAGGASGGATTGGLFTGDSTVRDIRNRMVGAVMDPVDGRSPAEIGISITREGVLQFDEQRFAEAHAADPDRVAAVFGAIATRVAEASTSVSASTDGELSRKITGRQQFIDELGRQIESWDTRLERRRTTLERTYAALEVAISNLNSQSDWLGSQLSGLTSGAKRS